MTFKFPAEYLRSKHAEQDLTHLTTYWKERGYKDRPSRAGIPNRWSREYFALATPHDKIAAVMEKFENAGLVPVAPMPETDDAIAKATLKEAVTIALHPAVPLKDKLVAINTCLAYTKMKPVTKADINVKRPEDWLVEAVEASKDA